MQVLLGWKRWSWSVNYTSGNFYGNKWRCLVFLHKQMVTNPSRSPTASEPMGWEVACAPQDQVATAPRTASRRQGDPHLDKRSVCLTPTPVCLPGARAPEALERQASQLPWGEEGRDPHWEEEELTRPLTRAKTVCRRKPTHRSSKVLDSWSEPSQTVHSSCSPGLSSPNALEGGTPGATTWCHRHVDFEGGEHRGCLSHWLKKGLLKSSTGSER